MTPAERSQAYCPSEWIVTDRIWFPALYEEPILVYIVEPSESDAHDPFPPYHYESDDGTPWYDTGWGTWVCIGMIVAGVAAFWAVVAGLIGGAA